MKITEIIKESKQDSESVTITFSPDDIEVVERAAGHMPDALVFQRIIDDYEKQAGIDRQDQAVLDLKLSSSDRDAIETVINKFGYRLDETGIFKHIMAELNAKQGVSEGSQEINWVKPNFDFEWHEVEEQSRMKQVPADVRRYYQKHFPNKDAWLKAVQNGKAVVVPPNHSYEIRNAPFDKESLQKVLAPTGHEGPIGPAKEKRVNALFDKGQVEMPIILKTSQGLWLIGGKTRLGTANYIKGIPAKVWMIGGEQGVAEGSDKNVVVKFSASEYAAMSPEQKAAKQQEWRTLKQRAKRQLKNFTIVDTDKEQGVAEGTIDIGSEWMSDTELDQYVPDQLEQEWRELVGYDMEGRPHPLWANMTGGYEPDVNDPQDRANMVKVANKWFAMKRIPGVRFLDVRDADDELEWLVQIGEQGVSEGKITLSTDPNWYGAEVGDYKASGPVVNIPANKLVGFEPDDKMNQPASKANVAKIVAGIKQGAKLPPLLVRRYKNGYQLLDGHHRFWAYKLLGVKDIPAQVVPDSDIEEKGQQGVSEGSEQQWSIQQLATISDEALDRAYGYGRSTPGNTFGWQANLMSAAYAKKMIDAGETDIERIADAIHKGWNVTAKKFVANPDQFSDTAQLRQAGKLDAKLQQRAKLMKINYAELPDQEQEKDRVVARALLQALKGSTK